MEENNNQTTNQNAINVPLLEEIFDSKLNRLNKENSVITTDNKTIENSNKKDIKSSEEENY